MKESNYKELIRAHEVVLKLRDPKNGCPWDLKQNHETLLRFLIEESYEYMDAVHSGNSSEMEEELGDVLLQVLLHSVVAQQNKTFNLESVSKKLADKLIRRHPHVFDNPDSKDFSIEEIKENWEKTKSKEGKNGNHFITKKDNMFPALQAAYKIGAKTNKVNFDWEDYSQVQYKVEEEWQELKEELSKGEDNIEKIEEELGDLLFSAAQLGRHLGLNAEEVLHKANNKFINRFNKVEDFVKDDKQEMKKLSSKQLEKYWSRAKNESKK